MVKIGSDIAHYYVEEEIVEKDPDILKRAIQSVHSYLVDRNIRDSITLVHGGGIAEAAHISKSMIVGADVVSVGLAYQIALGCRVCYGDKHASDCRIGVEDRGNRTGYSENHESNGIMERPTPRSPGRNGIA